MEILKVQINHPGKEKPFKLGKGYYKINDKIIRIWNSDSQHFRKFMRNNGEYLSSINTKPKNGQLLFWGEWEGNSVFTPIENGKSVLCGIHEPFHSKLIAGKQNTDPYIFGNCFKYVTCSQSGKMLDLAKDSIILFGTTLKNGFELDTVLVVKNHESSRNICANKAENYSLVYREETLEKLGESYLGPNPSSKNKLYHSQTWGDNNYYFSFVPCKTSSKESFQKVVLPIPPMTRQKIGHPFKHLNDINYYKLWKFIVNEAFKQGFSLGIRFEEPVINNEILAGFSIGKSNSVDLFYKDSHAANNTKC